MEDEHMGILGMLSLLFIPLAILTMLILLIPAPVPVPPAPIG